MGAEQKATPQMGMLFNPMDKAQPLMETDRGRYQHHQIGRCVEVDAERASRMVREIQESEKY